MGASSGIGLRVAEILAQRGLRIGIAARSTAALEALSRKYPGRVEFASIDVRRSDAPMLLDCLIAKLGGMDLYLHVAGIGYANLDFDPERETSIADTNATGFARMLCAAYRYFRAHSVAGHIAAVTSVAAVKGIGRMAAYSASKAFAQTYLEALAQLARIEKSGVSFTDIRPGWVLTPLLRSDTKYPMQMSEEYAARRIVKALARRRRVCTFDVRWRVLAALWRMIPRSVWTRMNPPLSNPNPPLPAPLSPDDLIAHNRQNAQTTLPS